MFRSSRKSFRAGDMLSAAQKISTAITPANGSGMLARAAGERFFGGGEVLSVSAEVIHDFRAEAISQSI
jgi:hypothetical protein